MKKYKNLSKIKSVEGYKEKFIKVHGNKYDYSRFKKFSGWHHKIIIGCNYHKGYWFSQRPASHYYQKNGCPKCKAEKAKASQIYSNSEWKEKAKKVHGNKYNYSLVSYQGDRSKVKIICPDHGIFEQRSSHHLHSKAGCHQCHFENMSRERSMSYEVFLKKAKEKYFSKYTYEIIGDSFKGLRTKIKINCPVEGHGFFIKTARDHLYGTECPKCSSSKGELETERILKKLKISYERQKKFPECKYIRELPFDFYLPEHNLLIEFDGEQHYKVRKKSFFAKRFHEIKRNDQIKTNFAKETNLRLLRIRFDQKIESTLLNFIFPKD
tara:strand:+ start:197 stop:1168 length:972 start_codon:yes stop_codon:yes gene_type:complete